MIDTEIKVTPQLAAEHGLTPEEYARIAENSRPRSQFHRARHLQRDVERALLLQIQPRASEAPAHARPHVVQGPGENAGVVDIGDGLAAVFKIESHNHPSFVEPFQGAATGVGGILRDIFTMGARPIAVLDSLRFGPITPGTGAASATAEEIARNRRILDGVIRGIGFLRQLFRRAHRRRRSRLRAVLFGQSAGQRAGSRHLPPRGIIFRAALAAPAIP